jgi:hypothetical protein
VDNADTDTDTANLSGYGYGYGYRHFTWIRIRIRIKAKLAWILSVPIPNSFQYSYLSPFEFIWRKFHISWKSEVEYFRCNVVIQFKFASAYETSLLTRRLCGCRPKPYLQNRGFTSACDPNVSTAMHYDSIDRRCCQSGYSDLVE